MRLARRVKRAVAGWSTPAVYAAAAIAAGLTLPRFEARLFPGLATPISVSAATAIYSSIASGMIALTGIVFSLTFVMVQFSATAYSPRLVLWVARDPAMTHALGVFTATFLYAIAALAGVDRGGSGIVPFVSAWVSVGLLIASSAMFVVLIHRISLLQINNMLVFTGDQARRVIETTYPKRAAGTTPVADDVRALPCIQTLVHRGGPASIQRVDVASLVRLARASGSVVQMVAAVGDTVVASMPLLRVRGAGAPIDEGRLRRAIELGTERTFAQDPKYAIRLLVDIAIKALSPAINDPTTGVQALDQIEDLLLRLGHRQLEVGRYHDAEGALRVMMPFPSWDDLLRLAFDEIAFYGATSVQVMRRMNALVSDLAQAVPAERRPQLAYWEGRLKSTIARAYADDEERREASREDRQGLGVPREIEAAHAADATTR